MKHKDTSTALLFIISLLVSHQEACQYRNHDTFECIHSGLTSLAELDAPDVLQKSIVKVDLSNNKISTFSTIFLAEIFPTVHTCNIQQNRISNIEQDTFVSWPSLQNLKLSYNNLMELKKNDFTFCPNLKSLYISNNKIKDIDKGTFNRLHNLTLLDLSNNRITFLETDYFWGLWNLKKLILRQNGIYRLDADTFSHTHSLRTLDISWNKIRTLRSTAFRGLAKLDYLSLSSNLISVFPNEALHVLGHLITLDISDNKFKIFYSSSIVRLNIENLYLNSSNELTYVDVRAVDNLPFLKKLDFSYSRKLKMISGSAFYKTTKLESLYISSCALQAIPYKEWKSSLSLLTSIKSENNPIEVTPNSTIIINLFPRSIGISEGHKLKLPCRSYPDNGVTWILPANLHGHQLNHVTVQDKNLLIHDAFSALSGTYICKAINPVTNNTVSKAVYIDVKRLQTRLILLKVSFRSITVSWYKVGNIDDFVLMHRVKNSNDDFDQVGLKQYMKQYTVTELQPSSNYELCLSLKTFIDYQHLHCIYVSTKSEYDIHQNIFYNGKIVIILVATIAICMGVLVACLIGCSLNKEHKDYEGWSQASLNGSFWTGSQPMTFENRVAEDLYDSDDDFSLPDDDYTDSAQGYSEERFQDVVSQPVIGDNENFENGDVVGNQQLNTCSDSRV